MFLLHKTLPVLLLSYIIGQRADISGRVIASQRLHLLRQQNISQQRMFSCKTWWIPELGKRVSLERNISRQLLVLAREMTYTLPACRRTADSRCTHSTSRSYDPHCAHDTEPCLSKRPAEAVGDAKAGISLAECLPEFHNLADALNYIPVQ